MRRSVLSMLLATVAAVSFAVAPAYASSVSLGSLGAGSSSAETPMDNAEFVASDDGQAVLITLGGQFHFETAAGGTGVNVVSSDGQVMEELPSSAVNKNGQQISLAYKLVSGHTVEVRAVHGDGGTGMGTYGWWDDWGQCVAGTVGGAITGGLAGAGVGSVVPVIGTGIGGGTGAVGGGLTGAAASC